VVNVEYSYVMNFLIKKQEIALRLLLFGIIKMVKLFCIMYLNRLVLQPQGGAYFYRKDALASAERVWSNCSFFLTFCFISGIRIRIRCPGIHLRKEVYFPDDEKTKKLLWYLNYLQKITGKSFSEIARDALSAYLDREVKLVQAKLDRYVEPSRTRLEELHERYIDVNPERFPTWVDCLKANGLYTEEAIEYSRARGWLGQEVAG